MERVQRRRRRERKNETIASEERKGKIMQV